MKFKAALNKVKSLITVRKKTKSYMIYATIIIAILGIIGVALRNRENAKLVKEKAALQLLNEDRALANAELNDQLADLSSAKNDNLAEIERVKVEEMLARAEMKQWKRVYEKSKAESSALEAQLEEAHNTIAGRGLKGSFLADQITSELYNYFPESGHVFFSETQDSLFKTNPETANLIYSVIMENAVRIQIIGNLSDQVVVVTDLLEQTTGLVALKDEEIESYVILTEEFNETFDNLEAALSIERRTTSNLERQIAIMNRKNLFERILPSLNIVIGPYYDPFKNQYGVAVALGLGWRF